jgi:hypothetical protein
LADEGGTEGAEGKGAVADEDADVVEFDTEGTSRDAVEAGKKNEESGAVAGDGDGEAAAEGEGDGTA